MLSAWFRFKYPNVVDGALAGSAPIYFVGEDLIPATAFFEKVTEVSLFVSVVALFVNLFTYYCLFVCWCFSCIC